MKEKEIYKGFNSGKLAFSARGYGRKGAFVPMLTGLALFIFILLVGLGAYSFLSAQTEKTKLEQSLIEQEIVQRSAGEISPGVSAGPVASKSDLLFCGGLNTVTIQASEVNRINTTAYYLAGLFRATTAGNPLKSTASATGTVGGTETLTSISILCGLENKAGHVFAVADTGMLNGHYLGTYDFEGKRTVKGEGSAGDELRLIFRNLAGTNLSDDTSSGVEDPTETTAVALGSGSSRQLRLDVTSGDVGSTQYGSDLGTWVSVDYIRPAAIQEIGFSGAGVTEIVACDPKNLPAAYQALGLRWPGLDFPGVKDTLAKQVGVDSADRCFLMTPQRPVDGTRITSINVISGSTDPATTDDPTLTFRDVHFFEYQGEIMVGGIDPAGTDVGQSNSVATINNS